MGARAIAIAGGRVHHVLVAVILFGVLTVALTWPVTPRIDEVLMGDDYDVYVNMWANWWTRKTIEKGLDFYRTDYIFFPRETSLAFFSFSHVNTALWLVLNPLIGRIAAYNVSMLLVYGLSGLSMYLLVHHLTHSRLAGLIAGLVFAFCPYHLCESAHPNLAAVQWMPLFALSLHRILHEVDASRFGQPLLGALWFLLTALSGWHLMLLLMGWTAVYLLYEFCTNRKRWSPMASCRLLLLIGFIAASRIPFAWPIVRDYLTTDATFATVALDEGLGNDLLSFIVPHQRHPLFSTFFAGLHDKMGYASRHPAYLGWVAIGLTICAAATHPQRSRVWLLLGLLFALLSLGLQLEIAGAAFLTTRFPWAVSIIKVLRHPYRLNTLVFLSLAVLVGIGTESLSQWVARRNHSLVRVSSIVLGGAILFEYMVYPFPTMEPLRSPFADRLAAEQEDFAIADFPMGRQPNKRYMFHQTTHEKRMVGGFVSREPEDAYAFVTGDPLLGPLLASKSPEPRLDIRRQLASLAGHGIRYIILHKGLLDDAQRDAWQERLTAFPTPFYEDSGLAAYRTLPNLQAGDVALNEQHRVDARIGDHIQLLGYELDTGGLSDGDVIKVILFWQSGDELSESYHVFVHLVDEHGQLVAQHDGIPMWGELPTWSWWEGEIIRDEHSLIIDRRLADGTYTLYTGMYDVATKSRAPAVTSTGGAFPNDAVGLGNIEVDHE